MKYRKQFMRVLFFVFLLACLLTGLAGTLDAPAQAAPQMQAATTVVISEFRTRGSNPGQAGSDEFIELYNPTVSPVDITGWKINGSNAMGTTNTRATIPAFILQPGQHYLVAKSGGYSGTVVADMLYTAAGITDDGGIAL